jgi:hypothetical protein
MEEIIFELLRETASGVIAIGAIILYVFERKERIINERRVGELYESRLNDKEVCAEKVGKLSDKQLDVSKLFVQFIKENNEK